MGGDGERGTMANSEKAPKTESSAKLSAANIVGLVLIFSLLFALIQLGPLQKAGLWLDELFALWASDPSMSLGDVLSQRILPDTNPPAYFLLLYWLRQGVGDVAAPVVLGAIFLATSIFAVLTSAKRAGVPMLGLVCAFFFLSSGPVLYYFSETRAYLCALAVTFVASWFSAQAAVIKDHVPPPIAFVSVGVLAASIHVYAALYCCALAAAMVCTAWLALSRRDVRNSGLALGMAAAATSAITMLPMQDSIAKIDWIKFDAQHVLAAAAKAGAMSAAPIWIALAVFVGLSARRNAGVRTIVSLFAIAYALFAIVPIMISFKIPIISARYWIIGSPGLIVLVGFAFWAWTSADANGSRNGVTGRKWVALGAVSSAIVLVSFVAAAYGKNAKLIWRGGQVVKPLIANCGNKSVRVANSFKPSEAGLSADGAFVPAFAYSSGQGEGVFVPVLSVDPEKLTELDAICPIAGWAENVDPAMLNALTDQDLLRLLNIEVAPDRLEIYRERSGFVILKKDRR